MRFAVKVGKDWKREIENFPDDVIVHVDLEVVKDYEEALKIPNQVVISIRPDWIGGEYLGSEVDRIDTLKKGIEAGADFVEIEADMVEQHKDELLTLCEREMCGMIVVNYLPKIPTKTELQSLWEEQNPKTDLIKFDCAVNSYEDCKKFLEMCTQENLVIAGHGEKGELLGILGGVCGFYFGYCPVEKVKKAGKAKLNGFGTTAFKKLEIRLSIAQPTSNKLETNL